MEIKFLKDLKNNPRKRNSEQFINEAIPETEITQLEVLYNNGSFFPKALKELLYLAGDYCYVLDYGMADNQQEMQEDVQERFIRYSKSIARPFYVIDVFNGNSQFLFVYLDEGDDPAVYEARYSESNDSWISLVSDKLSKYVSDLVKRVKEGRNPF